MLNTMFITIMINSVLNSQTLYIINNSSVMFTSLYHIISCIIRNVYDYQLVKLINNRTLDIRLKQWFTLSDIEEMSDVKVNLQYTHKIKKAVYSKDPITWTDKGYDKLLLYM